MNFVDPFGLAERKPGEKIEEGDTCDGKIVDGWCTGETITVEARDPLIDVLLWMDLSWVQGAGNFTAGFADTITFSGTRHLREYMGDDQAVNPCSAAYLGGEIGGTVWWTAFAGAVGGRIGGGNLAARELGQITVTDYAARGFGAMANAQKLEALGGVSGATLQALRNVVSAQWWKAVAGTTMSTGPTPAAWGGLVGLGVGGTATATSITRNCT